MTPARPSSAHRGRVLVALVAVVVLGLGAAVLTRPGRAAAFPVVSGLLGYRDLETEPRVRFERGSEAPARLTSVVLGDAIVFVEEALGRTFPDGVRVVVHATQASFNRWIGARSEGTATGAVMLGRLHLSPGAFERGAGTNVLVHELVHLHFRQAMGVRTYVETVPRWFQEGSAVALARSVGPEPYGVSPDSVARAFRSGRHFTPEAEGRTPPRTGADYGIPERLFYAQAGAFHAWLDAQDPAAYRSLLQAVEERVSPEQAFVRAFGRPLAGLWATWVQGVGEPGSAVTPFSR